MLNSAPVPSSGCSACHTSSQLGFELTMAFQPIVDVRSRTVWAYEALVRGQQGETAHEVLAKVNDVNRYAFDQACRVRAIALAAQLGMSQQGARLSINFLPGAVYSPAACIRRTLDAAREYRFPLASMIFEITEAERIPDTAHMQRIATEYARHNFTLALDDFGAGFSGLNLLRELPTVRLIKLDGALIRNIHLNPRAQQILHATMQLCDALGVAVLAECVETEQELEVLFKAGIRLMQGYLFARPGFECLPEVCWPATLTSLESPTEGIPGARQSHLLQCA